MKRIHFIGICGVAMSALAIAFKKAGWTVTGSDAGFFPPISTHLKENEIDFYPGWHPDKMIKDGVPDLVVVGNVASSGNLEWIYVQEHKLNYTSYPEVIAKYFIKPNSIVCAGTYGKTTTSALLSWILTEAGYDPSYMFGGLCIDPAFPSAEICLQVEAPRAKTWSVVEGDEYKSARWDMRPKFTHYSPTHLLLTSVVWDHADVYPTKESYTKVFQELISSIPIGGKIIICSDDPNIQQLLTYSHTHVLNYGRENADYTYSHIQQTSNGISFHLIHDNKTYQIESPMLGDYQAANITGAFAMADEIGIAPETIIAAIKTFSGLKRRLEKRFEGDITVFDDIAHSPAKAKATLETLRKIYDKKIIAIFEPNTGNRRPSSAPGYDHTFNAADNVIIPALTNIKKDAHDTEDLFDEELLVDLIQKTHPNVRSIPDDEKLIHYLHDTARPGDVIVFLGSHGFRGMIETLIKIYPNP